MLLLRLGFLSDSFTKDLSLRRTKSHSFWPESGGDGGGERKCHSNCCD